MYRSAFKTLSFSSRTPSGLEGHRRLHRHQAQDLKQVVLDHVAQAARLLEVAAARLDADRLGPGDLHVVDEAVVPTGSKMPLANRNTSRFWTVSFPR